MIYSLSVRPSKCLKSTPASRVTSRKRMSMPAGSLISCVWGVRGAEPAGVAAFKLKSSDELVAVVAGGGVKYQTAPPTMPRARTAAKPNARLRNIELPQFLLLGLIGGQWAGTAALAPSTSR